MTIESVDFIDRFLPDAESKIVRMARGIASSQYQTLRKYLLTRQDMQIGKDHAFRSIASETDDNAMYRRFAELPVTEYDDYRAYIADIKAGMPDILGPGHPSALTLSGGSSNPNRQKLVPLYSELSINHAGAAYIVARYRNKIRPDQSYINLVRPYRMETLPSSGFGHPIAMSSTFVESAFHGSAHFSNVIERVPFEAKLETAGYGRHYWLILLVFALAQRNLRYIFSIYPNVAIDFLSYLDEYSKEIVAVLQTGRWQSAGDIFTEQDTTAKLSYDVPRIAAHRIAELRQALECPSPFAGKLRVIWPELQFVVCVVTGGYSQYRDLLKERYGLEAFTLSYGASEAPIGYNLFDQTDSFQPNPGTFFELIPPGTDKLDRTQIRPLSSARAGQVYELVVTSAQSGFFRYRIGDLVRIIKDGPSMRFDVIGRASTALSVAHEMTQEHHLRETLRRVSRDRRFSRFLSGLGFVGQDLERLRYVCCLEINAYEMTASDKAALAEAFDVCLQGENDLYEHYRLLDLIKMPEVILVPRDTHQRVFEDITRTSGLDQNQNKPNIVIHDKIIQRFRHYAPRFEHAEYGSSNSQ